MNDLYYNKDDMRILKARFSSSSVSSVRTTYIPSTYRNVYVRSSVYPTFGYYGPSLVVLPTGGFYYYY